MQRDAKEIVIRLKTVYALLTLVIVLAVGLFLALIPMDNRNLIAGPSKCEQQKTLAQSNQSEILLQLQNTNNSLETVYRELLEHPFTVNGQGVKSWSDYETSYLTLTEMQYLFFEGITELDCFDVNTRVYIKNQMTYWDNRVNVVKWPKENNFYFPGENYRTRDYNQFIDLENFYSTIFKSS